MLKAKEIVEATKGDLISGDILIDFRGISIDSRNINPGDLFIALEGERFNGHTFVKEALEKGALGAVVACLEKIPHFGDKVIIKVENTLKALGDIAKTYREKFDIPVVAITGSNGKTTTKEMVAYILSGKFKTIKAKASFNNFVGLPLTLLEIKDDTQIVVLEMETNLLGGIKKLSKIAQPLVGIVTNIGDTHLEYLKSRENVFREKVELIESLLQEGAGILNYDDPYVVKMKESVKGKLITFGIDKKANFYASHIKTKDGYLVFTLNDSHKIKMNTISYTNIYNALAAISVASFFSLDMKEVVSALENFKFPPMRMELIDMQIKDNSFPGSYYIKIINDCYNANPQSMEVALSTLKNMDVLGRRVAILGDMLELGKYASRFHYQIGKICALCKIDILLAVGEFAQDLIQGAEEGGLERKNIFTFKNVQDLNRVVENFLEPNDTVLIKGSRKMQMEKIIERLKERLCQK